MKKTAFHDDLICHYKLPGLFFLQKIASLSKENVTAVPPCINADGPTTYLNTKAVRKALHIPDNLPQWTICSDHIQYHPQYDNMRNQYLNVLTQKVRFMTIVVNTI